MIAPGDTAYTRWSWRQDDTRPRTGTAGRRHVPSRTAVPLAVARLACPDAGAGRWSRCTEQFPSRRYRRTGISW